MNLENTIKQFTRNLLPLALASSLIAGCDILQPVSKSEEETIQETTVKTEPNRNEVEDIVQDASGITNGDETNQTNNVKSDLKPKILKVKMRNFYDSPYSFNGIIDERLEYEAIVNAESEVGLNRVLWYKVKTGKNSKEPPKYDFYFFENCNGLKKCETGFSIIERDSNVVSYMFVVEDILKNKDTIFQEFEFGRAPKTDDNDFVYNVNKSVFFKVREETMSDEAKKKAGSPYVRPKNSLSFGGSGDINGDNQLNLEDYELIDNICSGRYYREVIDRNRDKVIDRLDTILTNEYYGTDLAIPLDELTEIHKRGDLDYSGGSACSDKRNLKSIIEGTIKNKTDWFNLDRTSKEKLVKFFLEKDTTNKIAYSLEDRFACGSFAAVLRDHFRTELNLPMYDVSMWPDRNGVDAGHAINAILVGGDSYDIRDWMFIEPQSDEVYFYDETKKSIGHFFEYNNLVMSAGSFRTDIGNNVRSTY